MKTLKSAALASIVLIFFYMIGDEILELKYEYIEIWELLLSASLIFVPTFLLFYKIFTDEK